jgi:hypothetical protein
VDVKEVVDRAVKDVTDVDLSRKVHSIGMGLSTGVFRNNPLGSKISYLNVINQVAQLKRQ